jgi:hypothetical protein
MVKKNPDFQASFPEEDRFDWEEPFCYIIKKEINFVVVLVLVGIAGNSRNSRFDEMEGVSGCNS